MPGLNGFELCRRLQSNPASRKIPVIFCSSNATDVDRYWACKQGAIAYLSKPFAPQDLIATIHQILQRSSPRFSLLSGYLEGLS